MELIFAAAVCSVMVSILLKIAKQRGLEPMQMIGWNYAIASILCFIWFKPDFSHLSVHDTPWWLILGLGVLLPSIFLCLAKSLTRAGIIQTEIAQRLSVVLSLAGAYFIFQEQFNSFKVLGIALGIFAVLAILYSHRTDATQPKNVQGIYYLLLVWVGYAGSDLLLKYTTGLGLQFAVVLNLMFVCAFILSMLYIVWRYKHLGDGQTIAAGLVLGILNFSNIALYVKAHMLLKDSPAIVFAAMNIFVVMLGVIVGILLFKEKLRISSTLGLVGAVVSVTCLAWAMTV